MIQPHTSRIPESCKGRRQEVESKRFIMIMCMTSDKQEVEGRR